MHREELLEDKEVAREVKPKALVGGSMDWYVEAALWLGRLVDREGSRGRWRLVGEGSRGTGGVGGGTRRGI